MTSPSRLWQDLDNSLQARRRDGLLRERRTVRPLSPTTVEASNGQHLIHFGSNDYLSLSWHPKVQNPAIHPYYSHLESALTERFGAGASPLLGGHTEAHEALRLAIAELEGTEDALVFSSGFAANLGVVTSLATSEDVVFSDELNHASLIDGCRLSRAKVHIFRHNDLDHLQKLLKEFRQDGKRGFLVTDSLFSMDGDLARVRELEHFAEEFDLVNIVDEAHATGVYGERGAGLLEECKCLSDRWIKVGTLSKAIGCVGGFVAGPAVLIRWLCNHARSYIYSTSQPVSNCWSACNAIRLLRGMRSERLALRATAEQLRAQLRAQGHRVGGTDSPILSVYAPTPDEAVRWSQQLAKQGLYVPAIRPPTVPSGSSLLRISLNTSHSEMELERLVAGCRF